MRSVIGVAILLIAAGSTPAGAQPGTWTSRGPEGGRILALAIDPRLSSTIYAGTSLGGVFKSTDSGDTWSSMGPANAPVSAFAIDAQTHLRPGERPERLPKFGEGRFRNRSGGGVRD